jgi:hypothetical protein
MTEAELTRLAGIAIASIEAVTARI